MRERGNILFLILLAVVLFAALAYAVTSSMRGGGKDASGENNRAAAAAVLNYMQNVSSTVMRMTLSGSYRIEDISFERLPPRVNSAAVIADVNSNCTSNSCKVFHADGGGITAITLPSTYGIPTSAMTTGQYISGAFDFPMIRWPFAGTDANDLTIRYLHMRPEICDELLKAQNVVLVTGVTGSNPPVTPVANWDVSFRTPNNPQDFVGKDIYVNYDLISGVRFCHITQLLYPR